jgi:hypothetical protein
LIAGLPHLRRLAVPARAFNSGKRCSADRMLPQTVGPERCADAPRKVVAMPLAAKIDNTPRPLPSLRTPAVVRDFAALFGAAAAIGVAVSVGLMLAVIGLT